MRLVLTTPPAAEPLTADEVKARLGVGDELADAVVNAFVTAARQTIDGWSGWLGRALITQQWTMVLPCFERRIRIPLPPLQAIDSVKYVDLDGEEQTVDDAVWRIVQGGGCIALHDGQNWPAHRVQPDAVRITFTAGYGDAGSSVPEPIRTAIVLMVSNLRSLTAQNLFLSEDTVDGMGTRRYVVGGNAQAAIDAAVNALLSTYRVFA